MDNKRAPVEQHRKRLRNFISVPAQLERFLFSGYMVCLDVFLSLFTTLPLGLVFAGFGTVIESTAPPKRAKRCKPTTQEWYKMSLIAAGTATLLFLNPSHMYHSVRGQSAVKLYVIFNLLEVGDKLCASFGVDVLMAGGDVGDVGDLCDWLLIVVVGVVYAACHSTVLLYQLITLNVAINSYSNALLTLLVSNQFVELKSAVFKKFDRQNLFQLSCGDAVERFQLSLYLAIIVIMSVPDDHDRILVAVAAVWGSELVVDWFKHAFIGKFNHIHSHCYATTFTTAFQDIRTHADSTSQRMGFTVIPFASIFIRMLVCLSWRRVLVVYGLLVALKITSALVLDRLANHYEHIDHHHCQDGSRCEAVG